MDTSKKHIPALRFPSFEGEWGEKKLGRAFRNSRKKGNVEFPIYSVSQSQGLVPRNSLDRIIQNDAKADTNLAVFPGEIVYNMMRMWQGAVGLAQVHCMVSPAYVVLSPVEKILSDFFIYYFEKRRTKYLFMAYSYGLTLDRLRLYFKDFADIKLNVPSLPEQQKIADFLSAVDARIQALRRKKELLEQYKKGMMQKLFSQEIRFPGFEEEWEEKRLGDVCKIKMGQSPDSKSYNSSSVGFPLIQGNADIKGRRTIKRNWTTEPTQLCKHGEIIMTVRAPVGYIALASQDSCIGRGVCVVQTEKKIIQPFIFQRLIYFEPKWVRFGQGSTFMAISGKDIRNLKFLIPSLHEQQKIANLLSSIDRKIEGVETQLNRMEQWKKGLLQNMFC